MQRTKQRAPLDFESLFMSGAVKKGEAIKTLFLLYKGRYGLVSLSLFFFLIKHSPVWVIPVVTANIINAATHPAEQSPMIIWVNFAVAAFMILQNIPTHYLFVKYLSRATRQVEAGLRSSLIRKLQHLSISSHSELRSGKMHAKIIRDAENVDILSKQAVHVLMSALTNTIVAVSYTASKSMTVALFFLVTIPIAIGLMIFFRKNIQEKNRAYRTHIESMSGQVAETITMLPVTRAHGLEKEEMKKTDGHIHRLRGKAQKLDLIEALFTTSGWVVFQLFQVFCLIFTAMLAYRGQMPIGDVVMYQGFFATILMSISQIIAVYPQLARGYESILSISEVMMSNQLVEYSGTRKPEAIRGEFLFEQVSFRYPNTQKHVLDRFSLHVQPGQSVAIVGESGAGKSTVLHMVLGFYRPEKGRVLLDGLPFDELDMTAYRQRIAVVPQSTVLFSGTIRENILYGLTGITDEQLQHIIAMTNLEDVIAAMPDGLETRIGENGGKLSGGQKQRIAIARALIRDPQVILFDEATSALDNQSEFYVQQAIDTMIAGRTTFIVAHRLSTIRKADVILVMKDGKCIESGTFEELTEKGGYFYQLRQLQI